MLAATMHHRALALALALLLLLTQQLGAQHRASHGLVSAALATRSTAAATRAPMAAWLPGSTDAGPAAGDPGPPAGSPADAQCQVCLLLAALTVAALPALLHWRGLALRSAVVPAPPAWRRAAAAGRPYQARAPPG